MKELRVLIEYIGIKNILLYLLIINLIGFFAMGIDKYKAKKDLWRIPEGTLMMMCLLGGGFGTILGMHIFRHKTKKLKFSVGMPTILISEIILVIYIIFKIYVMQ